MRFHDICHIKKRAVFSMFYISVGRIFPLLTVHSCVAKWYLVTINE